MDHKVSPGATLTTCGATGAGPEDAGADSRATQTRARPSSPTSRASATTPRRVNRRGGVSGRTGPSTVTVASRVGASTGATTRARAGTDTLGANSVATDIKGPLERPVSPNTDSIERLFEC